MIGAENNSIAASKPPLLDLLNLNIAHWKLSVSYHYGLWLNGLPTPVFSGFSNQGLSSFTPLCSISVTFRVTTVKS